MKTLNKDKVVTVETWLPVFTGFYGTIWETDGGEENELYEINSIRKDKGLPEIGWDDVKWSFDEYRETVSKGITRRIESDLKALGLVSAVKFQELRSPREYNFANDAINVEVILSAQNKTAIKKYLGAHKKEFAEHISERYTSRSGFFSSHSNDAVEWLVDIDAVLEHAHKLGSVLNFILLNENGEDYEQSIFEDLSSNGAYVRAINYDELTEEKK